MVEETSHVKPLSLKHVCKIGLKDVDEHVMQKAILSPQESKFFFVEKRRQQQDTTWKMGLTDLFVEGNTM